MKKVQKTHRQKQKENTRQLIVDTAHKLFSQEGYSKTTMRTLAEHAGIGLGTIFKHFPDKPSLLAAAFHSDLEQIINKAWQSMPTTGIREQLLHISRELYSFYAENLIFARTLLKEVLFLEGEYGEILDTQVFAFLAKIAELIQQASANGELQRQIEPQQEALIFWSLYFSVLIHGLKQPQFNLEQQYGLLASLVDAHFFPGGKR